MRRLNILVVVLVACSWTSLHAGDPANNNRTLGMNLTANQDWSTELPFVDVFHSARSWISQQSGQAWGGGPALDLDAHGWVHSLQANCWAETPMLTGTDAAHTPTGDYIVLWDGDGDLAFNQGATVVNTAAHRIVIHVTGPFFLQVRRANPSDNPRNIRVIMPGYESTYASVVFTPWFLERWKTFRAVRYMDLMQTNGSAVVTWNDRPKPDDATWTPKGVPLEILVDLANRLHADPWFCMPHRADDTFINNFATYVRDHLDPLLRSYVEYSNEVWNGAFAQQSYASQQGLALNLDSNAYSAGQYFYAKRAAEVWNIWNGVLGGHERLVRVLASQAASDWWSGQMLDYQPPGRSTPVKSDCDVLAIAPYFACSVRPSRGSGDPAWTPIESEVATWSVDQVISYFRDHALPEAQGYMTKTALVVSNRPSVKWMVAYEGGQHANSILDTENNTAVTAVLTSANRDARMTQLYRDYFDIWRSAGGGMFMVFSSTDPYSKWGSWGLIEYYNETTTAKFSGATGWNNDHPADNAAPVIALGGDRSIAITTTLALTPTVSDDGKSRMPVLYRWTASNAAVHITNSTAQNASVTIDTVGTYTLTLAANDGFAEASTSITVTATNAASTPPPAAPTAPVVTGNNSATPSLAGTAPAGLTVHILVDGSEVGTATTNSSGAWTFTLIGLTAGTHQITSTVTTAGGTSAASVAVSVNVTAPSPGGSGGAIGTSTSSSGSAKKRCGMGGTIAVVIGCALYLRRLRH